MDDCWDFTTLCSDNNRDGNETSLGEYNIGFQLFEKLFGFMKSFENDLGFLPVLSYSEIADNIKIQSLEMIALESYKNSEAGVR